MAPGPLQILLIIILVLLVFGANKVPNIMENVAKGIKGFKQGLNDDQEETKKADKDDQDAA